MEWYTQFRFLHHQVNKTSSSIRVIPSRSSTTIDGTTIASPASETQMLRLLNSAAQKREVKATQNLSIIVAFFMICWIPLYTMNCINAFCKECLINETLIYFAIVLSHLNSAINPLLYAYHLKDFRGALFRLLTCTTEQEAAFRPSHSAASQNRISSQVVQRRSFEARSYIDSPVWKREQHHLHLETISEGKKVIKDFDASFEKWDTEMSSSPRPVNHQSPLRRHQSSQTNKIFIISDNHLTESDDSVQPQGSSLYRIAMKNQE